MQGEQTWYSPWSKVVEFGGEKQKLWQVEARDLARGFCGALFLALPLLYTLEMWERARAMPSWDLVIVVVLTYFGNVGFALFGNYKAEPERQNIWLDAATAMGIGLVASAITLFLVGRYGLNTPPEIMIKVLLLETVPSSFGASLAINQLGKRDTGESCDDDDKIIDHFGPDFRKILGTILGATIFAFNVAPTIEPKVITYHSTWWHTLAILAFSLVVSWLMVFFASFCEPDSESGVLRHKGLETVVSYLTSLAIGAGLLWMFGYLNFNTPPQVAIPWVITLGYATTLGGSAGRLIL